MSLTGRIVIAFIASFVVLQLVQIGTASTMSLEKIIGVWYSIGVTQSPNELHGRTKCYQMNITAMDNSDQSFKKHTSVNIDGRVYNYYSYGRIANGEIELESQDHKEITRYTVTSYENGEELIIRDKSRQRSYELIARTPELAMSTRREFEKLTDPKHLTYFDHHGCIY